MNRRLVMSFVSFGAVMVFAGCGSSSSKSSPTTAAPASPSTTSGSAAPTTSAPAAPLTSVPAAAGTLGLADNAKIGKPIIVDSSGKTVYMFVPDGTSTTSKVPAAIQANWPPVTASGAPTVGSGLDQSKVAGTTQVSYNGHLLYTFVGDKAAGDANGQGLGNVWYALSASGDKAG